MKTVFIAAFVFHIKESKCLSLNARSVRKKSHGRESTDFIVDNDIDILAMTETWLRPGTDDSVEIGTLCPTGYRVIHVPKSHSAGGGVNLEL